MRPRPIVLSVLLCAALSPLACSSGGSSDNTGPVTGGMKPCATAPLFDVWSTVVNPAGRNDLTVTVDTVNAGHAAEFRLTVACQGVMLDGSPTIAGMPCSFPPPPNADGALPECPRLEVADSGLGGLARARCLFEVVPTEPLGIGNGLCADPGDQGIGQYRLNATVGGAKLTLTQIADDCSAAESCLATYFGINVTPQPTATVTVTPTITPAPPPAT